MSVFRRLKHGWRAMRAKSAIQKQLERAKTNPPLPHGLGVPLIISLKSFPARYKTLGWTIKSLRAQTMSADKLVLWLEEKDAKALPQAIVDMQDEQFEIALCRPIRSYGKIIPALERFDTAAILTVDDDVAYPADMVERLVNAQKQSGAKVLSHRANQISLAAEGHPKPYHEWQMNLKAPSATWLTFPTGVSGILYMPGIFHSDVTREDLFLDLAPSADDIWLYWMWRMQGHICHKIGGKTRILEWPDSQTTSLRHTNTTEGGNDRALAKMIAHYGFPGE